MNKTAIITVPRIEPHRPPAGAAIIAAICENLGHNVSAYDLNINFFWFCKNRNLNYYEFDPIWETTTTPTDEQQKIIRGFIDYWIGEILKEKFDHLLISVFGSSGCVFAKLFLETIRPQYFGKIVIGGMGVEYAGLNPNAICFGQEMYDRNLVDTYIAGEGENSIKLYFDGKDGPGINNTQSVQVDDLDSLEWPNYKFFPLDSYDYLLPNAKEVYITGSRGCVRRCGYCDIERYWPKFRYRSGKNIANEIIFHYEQHGITEFYFTDSLINGSRTAFSEMCEALVNYQFDTPISWGGQFIFRKRNTIDDDHFKMIKEAGGNIFYVGLETGSDRLRAEMGKPFTNEDVDYQLEQFYENGLRVMPLMFTGYITETLQDHLDTLAIFKRWQKYVATGTIDGIELGAQLIILPGAPVERMINSHGIEFIHTNGSPVGNLWQSKANPELTIRERIRRKIEVHEEAIKYNWPVWRQAARLNDLKQLILKNNLHTIDIEKNIFPIKVVSSDKL